MAMQDCGALVPEKILEDEDIDGQEDMRGVENFLAWVTGKANREIRRVALEGADASTEDYLAGNQPFEPSNYLSDLSQCLKRNTVPQMKIRDILGRFWVNLPNHEP